MARLFISHSSRNNDKAIEVRDWLAANGWDDVFLDLDPERGIVAGQRWAHALEEAATRCEAVLFLVSEAWLGSKWCFDEYQLAKELNPFVKAVREHKDPLVEEADGPLQLGGFGGAAQGEAIGASDQRGGVAGDKFATLTAEDARAISTDRTHMSG